MKPLSNILNENVKKPQKSYLW